MELSKEEFAAVVNAHEEIRDWAGDRLDSMLGSRPSRWPLILEMTSTGDVEFTWIDQDGDTQDFFCSFESLVDETDVTWQQEWEKREEVRRSAIEERKRTEARTELLRTRRAYMEATEKAREVGVLRSVDTSGML